MYAATLAVDVGAPVSVALPLDVGSLRLSSTTATPVSVDVNIPRLHGNTFVTRSLGADGIVLEHANGLGTLNLRSAGPVSVAAVQVK